jgi:DNA-binding NarL/FixJ family response regulator
MAHENFLAAGLSAEVQRIFLVEDSPIIRDSLIDALDHAEEGRRVVGTADTEDAAIQRIVDTDPDVAIIDINLREGSGMGVLKRLSRLREGPPVRIVYTNHYNQRIHDSCAQLGATHVLSKGGDLDELLDVLSAAH